MAKTSTISALGLGLLLAGHVHAQGITDYKPGEGGGPITGSAIVARHVGGWDALKRRATFYADHHSDLPLLAAVGTPVCVNPNRLLKRVALEFDWRILGLR